MPSKVRTRFAPSPTGYLHIGGLRTALYAYLWARKNQGTFILRIEDTDQIRQIDRGVESLMADLKKVGLIYDEGPDGGGDFGPYIQSKRQKLYQEYARKLINNGKAYYCFCTKEELEARRKLAQDMDEESQYKYDGRCRSLSKQFVDEKLNQGLASVIRQKTQHEGETCFRDYVYGEIRIENKQLDDQILIKADGFPAYNFANVIDDHFMQITHVIRGNEFISSTPKHVLLYQSFGWEPPEFIHLPLIVDDTGKKLSKRRNDVALDDYLQKGYIPEALLNYMALLGWSPGDDQEVLTLEQLIEKFSLDQITKSNAMFSAEKLNWLSGQHIRKKPAAEFHNLALAYYTDEIRRKVDCCFLSEILQKRVERLVDIPDQISFINDLPDYDTGLFIHKKMKSDLETAKKVLSNIPAVLEQINTWTNENLYYKLVDYAKNEGLKNSSVLWPMRIALCGLASSPGGATELAVLLGQEETIKRINMALARL